MTDNLRNDGPQNRKANRMPSASKWAMIGFLIIAGYFLITEHRAHVIQFLPFLLILACPLLHGMHGGHGHGRHDGHQDQADQNRDGTPNDRGSRLTHRH